jgi:hypothetical protein
MLTPFIADRILSDFPFTNAHGLRVYEAVQTYRRAPSVETREVAP